MLHRTSLLSNRTLGLHLFLNYSIVVESISFIFHRDNDTNRFLPEEKQGYFDTRFEVPEKDFVQFLLILADC